MLLTSYTYWSFKKALFLSHSEPLQWKEWAQTHQKQVLKLDQKQSLILKAIKDFEKIGLSRKLSLAHKNDIFQLIDLGCQVNKKTWQQLFKTFFTHKKPVEDSIFLIEIFNKLVEQYPSIETIEVLAYHSILLLNLITHSKNKPKSDLLYTPMFLNIHLNGLIHILGRINWSEFDIQKNSSLKSLLSLLKKNQATQPQNETIEKLMETFDTFEIRKKLDRAIPLSQHQEKPKTTLQSKRI